MEHCCIVMSNDFLHLRIPFPITSYYEQRYNDTSFQVREPGGDIGLLTKAVQGIRLIYPICYPTIIATDNALWGMQRNARYGTLACILYCE